MWFDGGVKDLSDGLHGDGLPGSFHLTTWCDEIA